MAVSSNEIVMSV